MWLILAKELSLKIVFLSKHVEKDLAVPISNIYISTKQSQHRLYKPIVHSLANALGVLWYYSLVDKTEVM